MKKILIIFFSIFFLNEAYSANFNKTYTDIPISKDVDLKMASPWNFHDDFESENLNFNLNCGHGKMRTNKDKLYEFKKEEDGNTYIAVTAKHKQCEDKQTERTEFGTDNIDAREKIVWFGIRMRIPYDFKFIDDRTLLWQFKHLLGNVSPIVAFRVYEEKLSRISIHYGGSAKKQDQNYMIGCKYDRRNYKTIYAKECKKYNDTKLSDNQKISNGIEEFIPSRWDKLTDGSYTYKYFRKSGKDFLYNFKRGEWLTFKVGVYTTKSNDGFVKVFLDDNPIFDYQGKTYDWKHEKFDGSSVRFGIYRDSSPETNDLSKILGFKGYPDQTVHYDDFVVTSNKKMLDEILGNNNDKIKKCDQMINQELESQCAVDNKNCREKLSYKLCGIKSDYFICANALNETNDDWQSIDGGAKKYIEEAWRRELSISKCKSKDLENVDRVFYAINKTIKKEERLSCNFKELQKSCKKEICDQETDTKRPRCTVILEFNCMSKLKEKFKKDCS